MRTEPTFEGDFVSSEPFELVSGARLLELKQHFAVYGELNDARDNVVLVFHALTGSARIDDWWTELIGAGKALDTNRNCFVCANYVGSCYGSIGANSIDPKTTQVYGANFPLVTTRDIVRAQVELLKHLKIERLHAVVGGSVGGQLALQFAVDFPDAAQKCVAIGACELPAMGLAFNHLQREALRQTNDVGLARMIAMTTYKSARVFNCNHARRFNRNGENPLRSLNERFDIAGYLDYQADIFRARFDVDTYNLILKTMDLFAVSDDELQRIRAETVLVGISSDWLFPASDVRKLCRRMHAKGVNANFVEMISPEGHDAFLTDTARTAEILREIL